MPVVFVLMLVDSVSMLVVCVHLQYMDQIQPVASRVPWMVGVGNHERDFPTASKSATRPELSYFTGDDSGGDCGVPTAFR